MNDFLRVVAISALAAGLTLLSVPLAERFDVPHCIVSGAFVIRKPSLLSPKMVI